MVSFDGFMSYIVDLIDNMSNKTADHLRANPLVLAHCIGAMKIITAISIAKESHVSFYNEWYHWHLLLSSFRFIDHTYFHPQTQKLEPPCTA